MCVCVSADVGCLTGYSFSSSLSLFFSGETYTMRMSYWARDATIEARSFAS